MSRRAGWFATMLATGALGAMGAERLPAQSMFRGGPAHTGDYGVDHGRELRGLAWRFPTRGTVTASPAVVGGRVFVGSGDGSLYALDLASGELVWSRDLGAPISSTAATDGERVHVVDRGGVLHTLAAATGDSLWSRAGGPAVPFPWGHESGDQYTSSPLLLGDTLVVAGVDGRVRALRNTSGELLWSVDLGARIVSSPAAGPAGLFVGDVEGRLHALTHDGGRRWTFETVGASLASEDFGFDRRTIQSSPAYADGRVFVGSRDGKLYALDAGTGGELWRADHGTSWVNTSPAVSDGVVYAGSSDDAFVHALEASTGREVWRLDDTDLVWASPTVAGDVLYLGDWGGRLRAVDRSSAGDLWTFPVGGMILSSPVVSGNLVLFGAADGGVYALGTGTEAVARYVFHDSALARATRVPGAERLARSLADFGYETVDAGRLPSLLRELARPERRSVVVFATDHLPVEEAADVPALFRRYLDAGGKVVWPGGPSPLLWPRDPETGSAGRYGDIAWTRATELLGVDHDRAIFDFRGARPTEEGLRWGLEGWWRGGWGIDPASATRVLAYDDWGLAAAWVKEYGGGPGAGFVFVPSELGFGAIHRMAEFRPELRPAERPARPDSLLDASLADYMARLEAFGFSGVLLVGRGDEVIHASAHGLADREAGRPFTTGTVVSLGSITKVYTAAAVLRLVDRGELALEDTLGAFVTDLPADRAGITLAQLLTHSSGLGELAHPDEEEVSRRQLLEETREAPLLDTPGASVSYSNLGFGLLAVVLEEVTGLPYEEALRREVLDPARAWETGYTRAGWGPERVAAGYRQGSRWGTVVEHFPDASGPSWTLVGNGGLHATVFDVFRFVRAFSGGRIVSPELADASMEPYRGRFPARGLGWQRYTAPDGTRAVGHDGSNNFLTASVRYLPAHDVTVVVAANQSGFTAIDVMPPLLHLVTGEEPPPPPLIDPEPLGEAERRVLAGVWAVGDGHVRVVDGGDHMELRVEGQALLNRVLAAPPELRSRLAGDTERALGIVASAREGDFSEARVLERVWNGLEEQFGPVRDVEVLGSAPVWYATPRASWLRFRFEGSGGTAVRRLHWGEDGTFYGVGGAVYPAPVSLRCVGTGPRTCTAMHLALPVAPVQISLLDEERAEVRIGGAVLDARRRVDPGEG